MLLNSFLEIVFCDLELCTNSLQYSHMYLLLTTVIVTSSLTL